MTREIAPLILRIFTAVILIYGTQDNVFSNARMLEFRDFLAKNGFPSPLVAAYVSAYAQFLCGILLLIGFYTRVAAAIMVINFIVAIVGVHIGLPFNANIAPMAMLALSVFFAIYGAPYYSLDARMTARRS